MKTFAYSLTFDFHGECHVFGGRVVAANSRAQALSIVLRDARASGYRGKLVSQNVVRT